MCIGITYEIFHCFGTEDVAKEQLKISDIEKNYRTNSTFNKKQRNIKKLKIINCVF